MHKKFCIFNAYFHFLFIYRVKCNFSLIARMIAEGDKSSLAHCKHFRNRSVIIHVYWEVPPLRLIIYKKSLLSHVLEQRVVWREVCKDLEFITFMWEKIQLKVPVLWSISKPEHFTIFTLKQERVHIIPWKMRVIESHWRFFESTENLLVSWVVLSTKYYPTLLKIL